MDEKKLAGEPCTVTVLRSSDYWEIFTKHDEVATVEFFENSGWFAHRLGNCFNACLNIPDPEATIPKMVEALEMFDKCDSRAFILVRQVLSTINDESEVR